MDQNKPGAITLIIAVLVCTSGILSDDTHAWQSENGGSSNSTQVSAATNIPLQQRILNTAILDGHLVLSGTNGFSGGAFTIRSSTNLAAQLAGWIQSGSGSFNGIGNFCVTNSIDPGKPVRFY